MAMEIDGDVQSEYAAPSAAHAPAPSVSGSVSGGEQTASSKKLGRPNGPHSAAAKSKLKKATEAKCAACKKPRE
eukprot:4044249-Amphidinium_carterae.1